MFIHLFIDEHVWVVFTFLVILNYATVTLVYQFLCGFVFSVLLGTELEVELLDHIVTPGLTFCRTARLFSRVAAPFSGLL